MARVDLSSPGIPPISPTSFSRSALKKLAVWIRDDLDLLVAREGPQMLRPDDALALHDTFLALQFAHGISLLDLRATGIHKAIVEIAGVATRWPSRLCNDCDDIIRLWTARFGPLSAIHPFLYGRGGRLEGIATLAQSSREDYLSRWSELCPEALDPARSHRRGDLGVPVGAWWINPLFAYHAGVVGLEACEGGVTYDDNGAYALVLKGGSELDATSDKHFTHRLPPKDKGKFRLTAATAKSRQPIRVLRSHSINSIWGPKAGVRYDGLYSVKGWSIKQAKTADMANAQWKEGDILHDVWFERCDEAPLSDAIKRPTAAEIDDYLEYKRLRKLHRQGKRTVTTTDAEVTDDVVPARIAPAIESLPFQPPHPPFPQSSPSTLRDSLFKKPRYDTKSPSRPPTPPDDMSTASFHEDELSPFTTKDGSSLLQAPSRSGSRHQHSSLADRPSPDPLPNSQASSLLTGTSTLPNIKEVAPWIDYDVNLALPRPPLHAGPPRDRTLSYSSKRAPDPIQIQTQTPTRPLDTRTLSLSLSPSPSGLRRSRSPTPLPTPLADSLGRSKGADRKVGAAHGLARRLPALRNRDPVARLFDGSGEHAGDDVFDRDAVCPPSEWHLVPAFRPLLFEAEEGEEERQNYRKEEKEEREGTVEGEDVEEDPVSWHPLSSVLFTDPFQQKRGRYRERKDSAELAPDERGSGSLS